MNYRRKSKIESECCHQRATKFLKENLLGCTISYDGNRSLDCQIDFRNGSTIYNTVWVEIKTCRKTRKNNIIRTPDRPVLFNKVKLGRFVFHLNQHQELLDKKGWYVFWVQGTIFGIKASELPLKMAVEFPIEEMSFLDTSMYSYPDWLRRLKCDVYKV